MNVLRARVHADFALAKRLARVEPENFASALIEAAGELGIEVTAQDVEAAVMRGRVEWMQRWLR
jgi:EAL domain-containing protein (putative c-di-GMP-specific phosphodiesterase class I)